MRLFTYLSECYGQSGDAAVFLARWVVVGFMLAVRVYAALALVRLAHVAAQEFYAWAKGRLSPNTEPEPAVPAPKTQTSRKPDGPSAWGE